MCINPCRHVTCRLKLINVNKLRVVYDQNEEILISLWKYQNNSFLTFLINSTCNLTSPVVL